VQLFALLRSNPQLLVLLADIMGTAPRLARIVSRRARLMDAVLDPGFLGISPRMGNWPLSWMLHWRKAVLTKTAWIVPAPWERNKRS
jgi:hypothetical protein